MEDFQIINREGMIELDCQKERKKKARLPSKSLRNSHSQRMETGSGVSNRSLMEAHSTTCDVFLWKNIPDDDQSFKLNYQGNTGNPYILKAPLELN